MYTVPLIVVVLWANPRLLNKARKRNSLTIFFGIICPWLHAKPETERVERLDAFMQQVAFPTPSVLFAFVSRARERRTGTGCALSMRAVPQRGDRHGHRSCIGDIPIK